MNRQIKIDKCYDIAIQNWHSIQNNLPKGVNTKLDLYNWYRYLSDEKLNKIYNDYYGE